MTAWTIATTIKYARPAGRTPGLLGADLVVTAAALLCTAAAIILSGCDFLLRGERISVVINGTVLMLLAGVTVGYLAGLAEQLEAQRQLMIETEATSRERERLARDIHDSFLQVLAMVQREGAEAGGEAAELGRLAGQQEAALRALISTGPAPASNDASKTDLRTLLASLEAEGVIVSGPAAPVMLEKRLVWN
jgi:signal transduction histidine kinase